MLMSNLVNHDFISHAVELVERDVPGSSARNDEFAKPAFNGPSDAGVLAEHLEGADDDLECSSKLQQKVSESIDV